MVSIPFCGNAQPKALAIFFLSVVGAIIGSAVSLRGQLFFFLKYSFAPYPRLLELQTIRLLCLRNHAPVHPCNRATVLEVYRLIAAHPACARTGAPTLHDEQPSNLHFEEKGGSKSFNLNDLVIDYKSLLSYAAQYPKFMHAMHTRF